MSDRDPREAIASALVLALFPALEAALMRGGIYREAVEAILAEAFPGWSAEHGAPIAIRAAEIARSIGPAHVLTPYGRELYLRAYPPKAIPSRHPPEANDNRLRRRHWLWRWLGFARA